MFLSPLKFEYESLLKENKLNTLTNNLLLIFSIKNNFKYVK